MVGSLEVSHAWHTEIECTWYFLHLRHGGSLGEPGCLQESRLSNSMTSREFSPCAKNRLSAGVIDFPLATYA
jgi:hypothetical protein